MNKIPEERGFGSGLYRLFFSNTKVIYRFFGSLYYVLVHTYTFILKYLVIPAERRSVTVCASSLQMSIQHLHGMVKDFLSLRFKSIYVYSTNDIVTTSNSYISRMSPSFRNLIPRGTCKIKKVHVKLK